MDLRDDEELRKSKQLDNLKQKLYSPNEKFGIRSRRQLHKKDYELESDWEHETDSFTEAIPRRGVSLFAKLFIAAFLFFAGALFYGAYVLTTSGPQTASGDIDIAIIGPVSIGAGETLSYDIVLQNNNSLPIETVDLVIGYPDGSKNPLDLSVPLTREREGIGDLDPGDVVKRTKTVSLFGEENDNKQIEVGIEYRQPGISTIFKKKKILDVALQSSPIRIALNAVDEHTVGQELEMELKIISNSSKTLDDVLVVGDYPFGFQLSETSDQPDFGNNVWAIGKLDPEEEVIIKVIGDLQGQNNEDRIFHFHTGIAKEDKADTLNVTFTSLLHSIAIERPFFAIDLEINGVSSDIAIEDGQKRIVGAVEYVNNLNDTIYDGKITLKLSGDVLNKDSVSVDNGFYDSNTNTITWDATTNDELKEIKPRSTRTSRFSFASLDLGSASSLFTNPEILFDTHVTGLRVSTDNVEEEIENELFRKIRFKTRSALSAASFYGVGPFQNIGPVPPKAGSETQYTIDWKVYNTSNEMNNGKVIGTLPSYVKWNNKISPTNEKVSFDPVTRRVTWNVGTIDAGTGYSSDVKEVAFQITLIPSISQVGQSPQLITDQQFIGNDTFVNQQIVTTPRTTSIAADDLRAMLDASRVVE